MTSPYLNNAQRRVRFIRPRAIITRDDMLAAARVLERNKALTCPRLRNLRVCDDGSLHVFETKRWAYGFLSLAEVNIAIHERDDRDRHLPLWKRLTMIFS